MPSRAGFRRFILPPSSFILSGLLAGCGGPPPASVVPADQEYAQAMSAGRSAFDRGQNVQAAVLYEKAVRRGEARDDAVAIADAAYNLGVTLARDDQAGKAADALAAAERELARAGRPANDVRVVRARTLRTAGRAAEAKLVAEQVVNAKAAPGVPAPTAAERSLAQSLLGELAADRGDPAGAAAALDAARRSAAGLPQTSGAVAAVAGLDARLAEASGPPEVAGAKRDRHAVLLRAGGFYEEMADALAAAGRAYAKAGADAAAADRLYRAARAMAAQGREQNARLHATGAGEAAARAGDATTAAAIKELLERLGPMPAPKPGGAP